MLISIRPPAIKLPCEGGLVGAMSTFLPPINPVDLAQMLQIALCQGAGKAHI